MNPPATHYAKSGEVHVAYQVFGDGPIDLILVPGWISNLDLWWDTPSAAGWLQRFARFARVITFDKRGTGLSDRDCGLPTMEQRMDDIRAVMDAAGSEKAAVLGWSEGGSLSALFAATHPDRAQSLILLGAFARFESWFPTQHALEGFFDYVRAKWGMGENMASFSPSQAENPSYRAWWARRERASASPSTAIALMRMNSEIDVSGVLSAVRVPTLVIHGTNDRIVDAGGGRELARLIHGAELFETDGGDHVPWTGDDVGAIAGKIEEFLTGSRPVVAADRVLATILFTDIVASTEKLQSMGDSRWKELVAAHDDIVRRELDRFAGNEVKTLGDGFLATFDGPARATLCALSIIDAVRTLGIEVRAGVHTGEVERQDNDIRGLAVHAAARVMDQASNGECLVSRTVKDLVVGADLRFEARGQKRLKGLNDTMELFAAIA